MTTINDPKVQALFKTSMLSGVNSSYLEALYEDYLRAPLQVEQKWQDFFNNLPKIDGYSGEEPLHSLIQNALKEQAGRIRQPQATTGDVLHERMQTKVSELIYAFRTQGHLGANMNPLADMLPPLPQQLELRYFHLQEGTEQKFHVGDFGAGLQEVKLKELYSLLKKVYCGSIGFEFMHISNPDERAWLANRIETGFSKFEISAEEKLKIYKFLISSEGLEKYIGAKFPGAKRFSVEGADSLLVIMHALIERLGQSQAKEIVIGMAHRGRLNVLVNVLGKKPSELFDEFSGKHAHDTGSGDVKYHQGFSSDIQTNGGIVHLALAFNPSHLEIVSPVVTGSVRARQTRRGDERRNGVIPILIHGDAAFSGQGVVMETFAMSQTRGFKVGGSLHIVVNNQIGFTTSEINDARSTQYCTDIAKMVQAPIFHVNSDDPEAVLFATQLAADFRSTFNRDVVIDLVCYRRHGHNEADEPAATQPIMYQVIRNRPTVRQLYADELVKKGVLNTADAQKLVTDYRDALDRGEVVAPSVITGEAPPYPVDWSIYCKVKDWQFPVKTTFDKATFKELALRCSDLPGDLTLHSRVEKVVADRRKMANEEMPFDWGFAETMAYATLLKEGYPIRISGQDCGRGTFFHRHAAWHDQATGQCYIPLQNVFEGQPNFTIIDSLLSEEAVLGFEYGYSATEPRALVIWEAQFGDFANGAQVVIDQFLSSGEQKWSRLCGLVMLLPHGYEGQGPEHSSARLERFLQLCAEDNMQVCVPSTPKQVYHMLRRQTIRPLRKPLIVMSPKSFLRHKFAVSSFNELISGEFEPVIKETDVGMVAKKVNRVAFCSGKVYYDLLEARLKMGKENVALIRIEQLYPFPSVQLAKVLAEYPHVTDFIWCQEEPKNQGAWFKVQHDIESLLTPKQQLTYVGRKEQAAPACGFASLHDAQQQEIIQTVLT